MFFIKRLFPRSLFSRTPLTPSSSPSPFSFFVAHCSTSSPSLVTGPVAQRDSGNAIVSVWWDIENLHIPSDMKELNVMDTFRYALGSIGICGPLHIHAVGDMRQMSTAFQKVLDLQVISFHHVTRDLKPGSDKFLNLNLSYWVLRNPPPAHIFFLSGDMDFAAMLHRYRMEKYNILLATKEQVHCVLKSAATIVWLWDDVVRKKENLRGKLFNHPPDTLWYSCYEGPLEDPFTAIDRPAYSSEMRINADDHELFSEDSFWREVQNFVNTDIGILILSESRNRGNLARNIHKYGPPDVRSLTKSDVLQMIDVMLSDKKFVLEVGSGDDQYRYSLSSVD